MHTVLRAYEAMALVIRQWSLQTSVGKNTVYLEIQDLTDFSTVTEGDIRDTVVARWTAGQQCKRSILRQRHDS